MKALITGASSGLGKDLAIKLSKMGYDLILVSRDEKKLKKVAKLCLTNVKIIKMDLSIINNCKDLFKENKDVDLLINNAGYGLYGSMIDLSLNKELNMIDLNVKAVHVLTKLYLKEMVKKDKGRVLNVASIAGFMPGPFMNTYYATKSYVYRFTTAIYEELRKNNSNVKVSVLCPGPVNTKFNKTANVKFNLSSLSSDYVIDYTLKKLFKNKLVIIPGVINKILVFLVRFIPVKMLLKIDSKMQERKD